MKEYLIVDGYNIINAWGELKNESLHSLESARNKLIDIVADFQAYKGIIAIVVFDAHYVKNSMEKHEIVNGVEVVFTKEFESADNYIERRISSFSHDDMSNSNYLGRDLNSRQNQVKVATSDWVEQLVILGLGAARISAREFKEEIDEMRRDMNITFLEKKDTRKEHIEDNLNPKIRTMLEKWRREDNKA